MLTAQRTGENTDGHWRFYDSTGKGEGNTAGGHRCTDEARAGGQLITRCKGGSVVEQGMEGSD